MDLDDEDYLESAPVTPAAPTRSSRRTEPRVDPAAPTHSSRRTEPRVDPAVIDDDDTFTDIMSIFNRK